MVSAIGAPNKCKNSASMSSLKPSADTAAFCVRRCSMEVGCVGVAVRELALLLLPRVLFPSSGEVSDTTGEDARE